MSCKALQLQSCEVAGSTFQGRKFTFPARDISGDTFTAKVRGYNVQAIELTGVKTDANVYFSFAELEALKPGKYIIQYWAELAGIGREMIASEDFTVRSQPCSTCTDSADASFVLEFPNEIVEYAVTYNVVNIGGGGGGGSMTDAEIKAAYERNPNTNAFTDEEKQSISDLADAQSGVLAARDAANQAATNANDAALNAVNSAQVADNAAASVNTAIQGANTAATAANQAATAANSKISETEAARQSAITAANEANTAIENLPLESTEYPTFSIQDEQNNKAFVVEANGKVFIKDFTEATKAQVIDFVSENLIIPEPSSAKVESGDLDKYADVNHVITYGQSLSVGQTEKVITTSALFPNLVNFDGVTRTSPYDKSLTGDTYPTNRRLAFVPITERVSDGTPATGTLRETPTSGTLESLALEINKLSSVQFPTLPMKLLGSAPGWGATTVAQLSKGSSYYTQLVADVTAGKTLANASDRIYKVLAVTWTQGESDYLAETSSSAYKSLLIQLRNDLNTDIKAITGQSDDIAFVMYQTGASNAKAYPNIALAQYDLAMNTEGFYMATAMYQMKYKDTFHLKSESSKLLGAYYGFVINKIISEGKKWKPLHPKSHLIQGNICKLKFEVPKAPLQFQAANTVTLANKGFAVIKGGTDILTSVSIGDDGVSVNLKCSADPTGSLIQYGVNVTLTPGGTASSKVNMGNLSDSQGTTQTFNISGTDLKMDNWSPIFEYQL